MRCNVLTNYEMDPLTAALSEMQPKTVLELRESIDQLFLDFVKNSTPPKGIRVTRGVGIGTTGNQPLTLDLYAPEGARKPLPILIYIHGGGFVMGSTLTYDSVLRHISVGGYLVASVNYRLSPETPFPGALEDCIAAIRWIYQNQNEHEGDISFVAVAGDSAGGNLAAASIACLSQAGLQKPNALVLAYATLQKAVETDPDIYDQLGPVPRLIKEAYLGVEVTYEEDIRTRPIDAACDMPPTLLICGDADPLIADSSSMAEALREHDVHCEELYFEGVPHGFLQMESRYSEAYAAFDAIRNFLKNQLTHPTPSTTAHGNDLTSHKIGQR